MLLSLDEVVSMRDPELKAFLEERYSEASGVLDYKQTIYGEGKSKDEAHGEFLKDITGFANSQGGHIFIGVSDPTKLEQSEEVEEAIVGIEYGVAVAQALESVAARWIDPRLTGFKVVPLLLQKGGHVLIVHIPPGESRPHRVNHEPSKNWTFFIRHGESIRMMTTQEIRDAALSTLTGEQQARAYAREVCEEQKDELISTEPVFLLQAAPLLRLGSAWDVTNEEFSQVMFGSNNQEEREYFCSNLKRSPTLRGIRTVNAKTNPTMIWEVHRNGYVGAIVKIPPSNHKDDPHLYDTNGKLFLEFAAFCQDALDAAKADFPYLLKATIYNTKDTVLAVLVGVRGQKPSPKYPRTDIRFHELRRGTGQAFKDAVAEWPIC